MKEKRICKTEGCDKVIKRNNKSGFCKSCYKESIIRPQVYCKVCNNPISRKNKTGFCKKCYDLSIAKKQEYCLECGTEISGKGYTGMCHSCCVSGDRNPMSGRFDEKNPNFIHGESTKIHYCKEPDCNNEISYSAWMHGEGRCLSCAQKEKLKDPKNNYFYIDGESIKKHYCKEPGCNNEICYYTWKCGNGYCTSHSQIGERSHLYGKFGKDHHSYINGNSLIKYPSEFSETLKKKIHKRDNFTCQGKNCSMTQEEHFRKYGRNINVHHIDHNKQNCSEYNLITTCGSCNSKANYNQPYWQFYYNQKITKIYKERNDNTILTNI